MTVSKTRTYHLFAGIDIAAVRATAVWMEPTGKPTRAITIPQTASGYADLQQRLLATGHAAHTILVVRHGSLE